MKIETPEIPNSDKESFDEIDMLIAQGWRFHGNSFEQDQTYSLLVTKEGEEDRTFHTTKPYPKIVDSVGKTKEIL